MKLVVLVLVSVASSGLAEDCWEKEEFFDCFKKNAEEWFTSISKERTLQVSDSVSLVHNPEPNAGRSNGGIFDQAEQFIKTHDVVLRVPHSTSVLKISARNMDEGEISVVASEGEEGRSKGKKKLKKVKHKLRKIMFPIIIFVLVKAMTLVPLLLGVLAIKAWNALQLSFGSFLVSFGLAVFHLCKKLSKDGQGPHGWEQAGRNLDQAHLLAYKYHTPTESTDHTQS